MPVTIKRNVGRPSATENALIAWAVRVSEGLEVEQLGRDFTASGDSLNHLVVATKPNQIELLTASYVYFNIVGRGPGGFPPLGAIEEWIRVKGIAHPGITLKSLAFLIGRKMAEEGDQVYRGDREGLPYQEIVEASFDEVMPIEATKIAIEAANLMLLPLQKSKRTKVKRS